MRECVAAWNRKNLLIAWILGTFCSCGLMLSLTKEATAQNSQGLNFKNQFLVQVRTFYLSFSADRLKTFLLLLVLAALIYIGREIGADRKRQILLIVFAISCSFAQLISMSYKSAGSWDLLFGNGLNRARALWKGIALALVCYYILKILYHVSLKYLIREQTERSAAGILKGAESKIKKCGRILLEEHSPRAFWLSVGLMMLCWLPYFVIFYPGTSNEDTVIQLMEYFHIHSYINDMTAAAWADAFITNHHPYLLTLLFGGFIRLGLALGDIRLGVALYSLLHMVFLAGIFSGGMLYLDHVGVDRRRLGWIRLTVMFLPIFPLYSICMVKDTIYAAFCLIYILMMYEVTRTRGAALGSTKQNAALFAVGLLMMLTKVYGMYILVIVGVVYLLHYRKYALRTVASIFVPVLLYKLVFLNLLLPALGVAPGGIQEGLSVMIQQTSRYVTEYGDEVTEKERAAIDEVLVYDEIPEDYNPELSDPVKKKWRQDYTQEELSAYYHVWFEMFLKHPDVYVESLFHNTYQYYDMDKISSLEYYEFDTYLQETDEEREYAWLYVKNLRRFEEARYVVNQMILLLQKIPVLNLLMSIGMLPWILWFFVYLYIFRGRGRYVETLLIPLITFAVCLVSPDNGNYRYIMPIMFALPYLGVLCYTDEGMSEPRAAGTDLQEQRSRLRSCGSSEADYECPLYFAGERFEFYKNRIISIERKTGMEEKYHGD